MRDTKETKERDELAKKLGITPAAAQAELNAAAEADTKLESDAT